MRKRCIIEQEIETILSIYNIHILIDILEIEMLFTNYETGLTFTTIL